MENNIGKTGTLTIKYQDKSRTSLTVGTGSKRLTLLRVGQGQLLSLNITVMT